LGSSLALFLTVVFVSFLLWRERREKSNVSNALWIPVFWFWITSSKFVSQWLSLGGSGIASDSEGSPLDAAVFALLIISGLYVLKRRGVTLREFYRNNRCLTLFLVYCLLAIFWSDFPFIAAKRWIKVLGHPVMALVVLTDRDPVGAFRRLLKRTAYFIIPFSILFIKYYPQYGCGYDDYTGLPVYCGVTHAKNELGCDCMYLGLFFFWNTVQALKIKDVAARLKEMLLGAFFLIMIWWLLRISSSATSLVCMLVGISILLVVGLPIVSKRHIGIYAVVGILLFAVAEPLFGIYENTLGALGRDAGLTDRTQVWHDALQLQPNPILGAGFESFWLGSRLDKLWAKWWWHPLQAHDGYIEIYLNLGIAGLTIWGAMIISTFFKIRGDLLRRFEFGRLRLAFLFLILIYNFTEATFTNVSIVWTLFYLAAIDYPRARGSRVQVRTPPLGKANLRGSMAAAPLKKISGYA